VGEDGVGGLDAGGGEIDGCNFVVWFEEGGVRRSEADLRELVARLKR
jgi:hypothetical protein